MTKKKDSQEEKSSKSLHLRPEYASFVDLEKSRKKKIHFLKYGYDFAKLAAALTKYQGRPSEPIKTKKENLFGKDVFLNNPNVDLVFQIIAYSKQIKSYPENEENHKILADINKCRETGEAYCNASFQFIIDEFFKSSEDEVNSLMVDYLSDENLLIENLDDYEPED